jgi:subtilase family serine protease
VGLAPASTRIQLVFPLTADLAGVERYATAVSTPGSAEYRHYRSIAELAARFGASRRTQRLVVSYLRQVGAGSVRVDSTGLFADAVLPVGRAERVFSAPLVELRAADGSQFLSPAQQVKIPRRLRGLVTGVIGLDTRQLGHRPALVGGTLTAHMASQPTSARLRTGTVSPTACHAGATAGEVGGDSRTAGFAPNQYLTAYGFDPLHSAGLHGQGVRVALIEIDGYRYSDLKSFAHCFQLDIPALNPFGVGINHALPPGGEATLDLEVLDAAAPDLQAIDVYETRANAADALMALTAPVQKKGFKPQVISASLGLCEPAVKAAVGKSGIRNTEAALAMTSASGITFVAATGDQGSADCDGPRGHPLHMLAVNFPASSPFVTGVGGTNFTLNSFNHITAQLVWNDSSFQPGSAGGGGLSQLFGRPNYQNGTISAKHRSTPDVSMLADIVPGYAIFCSASTDCSSAHPWESVGGTSAATPLLAGGMALIDQSLLAHNKKDLGLVNPLLYKLGHSSLARQVFSDVLRYGNDIGTFIGNRRPLGCCKAHRGFDFASGWGSVKVANLAAAAIARQPSPRRALAP